MLRARERFGLHWSCLVLGLALLCKGRLRLGMWILRLPFEFEIVSIMWKYELYGK